MFRCICFPFINLVPASVTSMYNALIDVCMIWYKVPPGNTWLHYAKVMYNFIVVHYLSVGIQTCHPEATVIHFINNVYNIDLLKSSIKIQEQQGRASSIKFSVNVYPKPNQQMPTGKAWRTKHSYQNQKTGIGFQNFYLMNGQHIHINITKFLHNASGLL